MRILLLIALAVTFLSNPTLAATSESETLGEELLLCAGKFGTLSFMGKGGEAETAQFFDAANRVAGQEFVKREMEAANKKAAEEIMFTYEGKPSSTLAQVRESCLPLLSKAKRK